MASPDTQIAGERRISRERRIWQSPVVFPVVLFLIVASFYWKLTLTKQYDWVWGPDLAQQVLPWFEEEARQVQHHELPLWSPHEWAGQSMIGQAQPGTAYPLNWILFLIPRAHGHIRMMALQWYFIVIHVMAALFCYWLCRDLRLSRAASLIGGLVFSLAAYVGTTDWPQMVNGAVWAPLVFLFLLRAVRGYRPLVSAALSGAFLGTAWLAGHHQVPIYLTLTMGGTWLYFILRSGKIDWDLAKLAAVSFLFLFLVGALQILPAEEYGHLAKRWAGAEHELAWNEVVPYYVHQEYSLGALSLFAILIPGMNRHADPFVGVVAFSLALLGLALAWKHPAVKLFGAIAIAGIVYALGFNSVFQGFLYGLVPLVEKARVPSMAVIVFGFGIAVLAAYGADQVALESNSLWLRRLNTGILWFGLGLFAVVLAVDFGRRGWDLDDRVMVTALVAVLLAALLYGWRSGNLTGKQAFTLVTMLMLLELGNDSGYAFPHRSNKERESYIEQVRGNTDLADYIHQQPGIYRVEVQTDKLSPNWGTYQNFDVVKALTASVPTNMLGIEWHTWQTRLLLGVTYSVSDKPPLNDSQEVFTGQSGLKVYKNPGAFPRAWAVHELVRVQSASEVSAFISAHLGDLRAKALTGENLPALKPCSAADDVSVKRYLAERLEIAARMGCDGMVVVTDSYFPGWKATLDGKPVQIHEVDNTLRGVFVPQGDHTIRMAYRPLPVYLGAVLTGLGWLGAIGLAAFWKRE